MYQIDFHKPLHIHFIGIGGISMSGLAEILLGEDFVISGSDSKSSPLTQALEKKGATIYYGQRATNITDDVDVVVYTAAIHPDNPEFACAKEKGLPMLTRAELLGQIMRNYDTPVAISGTHGKTTTISRSPSLPSEISSFITSEVMSYSLTGFSNWDAISRTMRFVEKVAL